MNASSHIDSISQDDTHLVKFTGNVYYPTTYATKTQTTTVKLSAASQSYTKVHTARVQAEFNLLPYTQFKPYKSSNEKTLVYGPYENIAAATVQELSGSNAFVYIKLQPAHPQYQYTTSPRRSF